VNRLFRALHRAARGEAARPIPIAALPGFEARLTVLARYAENAAWYEGDLERNREEIAAGIASLEVQITESIRRGADRDALEYVRIIARLRPQIELIDMELRNFHAVASALILRTNMLMQNVEEARYYAADADLNPDATAALDRALNNLTRYFVMLERVAARRRAALPERLAELMGQVIDDRTLDLQLARYILQRRRALDAGSDD